MMLILFLLWIRVKSGRDLQKLKKIVMSLLNQTSVREVIIHPLVLLSVADHYHRVAKDTSRRVVGALLGTRSGHTIDVTNSFAVPFEEDSSNPSVWFLDHNYLEQMFWMFKRISS